MRTTVHLVRHGEVFNPDKVLYGRLPGFRLSDAGEEMARTTGRWFAARDNGDVTVVRSSPLERAVQTATLLAEAAGFDVERGTDERLIESENAFEGTRDAWKQPRNWWLLRDPLRPSWGEPFAEVAARMLAAVADARLAADGHEAVLVSHQLPIEVARRAAENVHLWHRPDRRRCALASVTSLVYDGPRLVDITYAEPAGSLGRAIGANA